MSRSRFICNDVLTRISTPPWAAPGWEIPKSYRVGDCHEKNGMPYRITGFKALHRDTPSSVWMICKFKGERKKVDLLIGRTDCFREKIVFGNYT